MSLEAKVGFLEAKVETLEEENRDLHKRMGAIERWGARVSGGLVVLTFFLTHWKGGS